MNLLWLIVNGEYAKQLSDDLIAAGYRATEIASTGDFLNFGNTILLLCIEAKQVDAVSAFARQRMNDYRHLQEQEAENFSGNDFVLYSIPLQDYRKVAGKETE